MYCGECGAKNNNSDTFCQECGAKLREVSKNEKQNQKQNERQNEKEKSKIVLTKQKKILIGVIGVLVIGLFMGYKSLEKKYSPKTLAEQYLQAINSQDYNTIYDLQSTSASAFITKDDYLKALKTLIPEKNSFGTIRVGEPVYENGRLNVKVPFSSSEVNKGLGSSTNDALNVTMVHSGKKYLFFDTWEIKDESILKIDTIEDYYLSVPKDTKITFGKTTVGKKYLDSKKENDYPGYVYYKLPKILKAKTDVTFTFPDGVKIKREITPSSYTKQFILSVPERELPEDTADKLLEQAKKDAKIVFENLANKKAFKDLKNSLSKKESSKDFEELYNNRLEDLEEETYSVSNFEISNVKLNSLSISRKYLYEVRVYVTYEYDRIYQDGSDGTDRRDGDYCYFYYTYEDGYRLVEVSNLPRF